MVKPAPLYRRNLPYYKKSSVDELRPYSPSVSTGAVSNMLPGQRILRAVISVGLVLLLIIVIHTGVLYPRGQCLASLDIGHQPIDLDQSQVDLNKKVDLEIFVMSKCPDAEDAEATLITVMENVGHKVALNFTYIATWQNTSQGLKLTCKHGPTECLGNKQQLCFQKYHPNKILSFITCLNRNPSQIGNSLSYALHCADRSGAHDYTTIIQPCAESSEGQNLLEENAERCDRLETHTSATIRIAGKNVCIRDGGIWKDCKKPLTVGGGNVALGLQRIIEKEWNKINSKRLFWQLRRM